MCLALWHGVAAWGQSGLQSENVHIAQASILLTNSETIAPENAAWVKQDLPDNWNRSRPGVGGFAWYRMEVTLTADQQELSALYVPRLSMNAMVYFNGEFVGGDGRFAEPTGRQWYRPHLYPVPQKLLRVGANLIHVRIKAYANNRGGLSEMHFGALAPVEAMWRERQFWQVTSIQITSAITLGLSALAFAAWSLSGFGSAYGYFAAGALIWALRNTHFLFTEIPVPAAVWEVLVATSLMWVMVLISMFVIRFAHKSYPMAERWMWGYVVAVPFIIWGAGIEHLALAITLCYAVQLVMGASILKLLVDLVRRERTAYTALLLCASLVMYGLATLDFVTQADALNYSRPYNLHFGAPIMFSVVALNMFQRFAQARRHADELALSLEVRVQRKNQELLETYEALRRVEANQFRAQERGRIMQDMHDGLGSQLVSSLAMAQNGELSATQTYDLLRSCIDDLRLAIDTSTDSRDSLALALGNLRFRMEPRLKAAGIVLKWDTHALQDDLPLPVEQQLPLLRVIQETITNTLKHAMAKTLAVTVSNSASELVVHIADDGVGFDVPATRRTATGKGLNSLEKRARLLGAALRIDSSPAGTHTHLLLPLPGQSVK